MARAKLTCQAYNTAFQLLGMDCHLPVVLLISVREATRWGQRTASLCATMPPILHCNKTLLYTRVTAWHNKVIG